MFIELLLLYLFHTSRKDVRSLHIETINLNTKVMRFIKSRARVQRFSHKSTTSNRLVKFNKYCDTTSEPNEKIGFSSEYLAKCKQANQEVYKQRKADKIEAINTKVQNIAKHQQMLIKLNLPIR